VHSFEVTLKATSLSSSSGRFWGAARRRVLRTLGTTVLPALLTGLVLQYLVPAVGAGLSGAVARLAHRHVLLFGVGLFLLFSSIAQYWVNRYLDVSRPPRMLRPALSRPRREALGILAFIGAAAGAAIAVRAYARPYEVLSASMLPTLEPDDLIAGRVSHGSADSRTPRRGDIVVFQDSAVPLKLRSGPVPDILVKRVLGLPGDVMEMHGDVPVINGWTVPTCDAGEYMYVTPDVGSVALRGRLRVEFVEDRTYLTIHALGRPFVGAYRVKPGEVFVLGDNRGNSMDSRAYATGHGAGVPVDAIEARVQWFLVGTRRAGGADLGRWLRPIDSLGAPRSLAGVQHDLTDASAPSLEDGIARCLKNRPLDTHPPPPTSLP
jgi:signal peptidase I